MYDDEVEYLWNSGYSTDSAGWDSIENLEVW